MRRYLLIPLLLALPFAAIAEGYSNAPLLVVGNGALVAQEAKQPDTAVTADNAAPDSVPVKADTNAMLANFPAQAVTAVDKNNGISKPGTPGAAAPNAISKKWPKDTVEIFDRSCAGFHQELIQPCECVITNLMTQMPHDEFIALNNAATIEQDARYQSIRSACATKPQQRK